MWRGSLGCPWGLEHPSWTCLHPNYFHWLFLEVDFFSGRRKTPACYFQAFSWNVACGVAENPTFFIILFSFQFRFGWIETTKSVLNLIESRVFEAKNQKHQVFNTKSRWWFQSFFYVHPDPCGSMIQFDSFILFNWVETQPPTPFKEKYKTPKVCPLAPHPWRPPPRSGASTNGLVQDIAGRQRTLIQRMAKDTFFGLKFAWGPKNKTMWNRTTVVFFCLSVGSWSHLEGWWFQIFRPGGCKNVNPFEIMTNSYVFKWLESLVAKSIKKLTHIYKYVLRFGEDAEMHPKMASTVAFTVRGLDAFGLLRGKLWVRKLPSYFSGAFKACRWMFLIFFVCLVVRLFVRSSIHSFILSILYSFTCLLLYSFTHSTHTHTRMYSIS